MVDDVLAELGALQQEGWTNFCSSPMISEEAYLHDMARATYDRRVRENS